MALICPTITATDKQTYLDQLKLTSKLASRIHIDIANLPFAPRELIPIGEVTWPKKPSYDVHLMVNQPLADITLLSHLKPNLVIIHAESSGDHSLMATKLKKNGIKFGVALLAATPPSVVTKYLSLLDHVLIFSGNLGYQGGSIADLSLLDKADWLRSKKTDLEIGWDGGVNERNIYLLAGSGIDVINVGGYIHHAKSPKKAYAKLESALKKLKN